MQGRSWCFTLNNYTAAEEDEMKAMDCKFMVFGHEVGDEEGTEHLQGYVHFKTNQRLTTVKKLQGRAHWELAKGDSDANVKYCTKQDLAPFLKGDQPAGKKRTGELGGAAQQKRYKDAWDAAKAGNLEEIPEDILIRHYRTLKEIKKDYMPQVNHFNCLLDISCSSQSYQHSTGLGTMEPVGLVSPLLRVKSTLART